jgi:ubiquitin carboxyl-terminal hydrolase 36/42
LTLQVDFDTHLDMAPYMSNRRAGPQMYELFGVLVHAGHSVHSGHYFCFVRAPNGLWHRMDDVQVSQVRIYLWTTTLYFRVL